MNNLTFDYKTKINTWKKHVPNIKSHDEKMKWIGSNHAKIYKYIKSSYANLNTLKGHISVLGSMLKLLNVHPEFRKKYSDESTDLNNLQVEKSKKQEMTESRSKNFVTQEEIIKKRDEYRQLFMNNKRNVKYNFIYLILSLYTYNAPLRHQYHDAQIVDVLPNNEIRNFILVKDHKYSIVIKQDKVIRSHGPAIIEFNDDLNKVIKESLEAFPRKYLLSNLKNGKFPLGIQGFNGLLKNVFPNKRVGINIFRSSYITEKYKDPNFTIEGKEILAKNMRHSKEIADLAYNKKNIVDVLTNIIKERENKAESNEPEIKQEETPEIINEPQPVQGSGSYYSRNKERLKQNQKLYYQKMKLKNI